MTFLGNSLWSEREDEINSVFLTWNAFLHFLVFIPLVLACGGVASI